MVTAGSKSCLGYIVFMSVHYSSLSNEWETPSSLFGALSLEFGGFDMDVAAGASNAKCDVFYDEEADGLKSAWRGRVWCNPPYGRGLSKWVKHAFRSVRVGRADLVVMLIPARTDTSYWHDYILGKIGVEVRYLRGRVKFERDGTVFQNAPFPSAVVIFRRVAKL